MKWKPLSSISQIIYFLSNPLTDITTSNELKRRHIVAIPSSLHLLVYKSPRTHTFSCYSVSNREEYRKEDENADYMKNDLNLKNKPDMFISNHCRSSSLESDFQCKANPFSCSVFSFLVLSVPMGSKNDNDKFAVAVAGWL